jgi:NitT/TauT family transport system permease protein
MKPIPKTVRIPAGTNKVLKGFVVAVAWILLWQILSMAVHNGFLVPAPLQVLSRLLALVMTWDFWMIALWTIVRIVIGFSAGILLGVLLAILTVRVPVADLFLRPAQHVIKATPIASFIILALVWIRGGNIPSFIAFLMVLPIVWANVSKGIVQTDPRLLEMAMVYRFGRWKTIRHIYLHSVMPFFAAAATTSMGLAWKAGIAAEVLALPKMAIGTAIYDAKIYLETVDLFAWSLIVILISIILEKLLSAALRSIGHAPAVRGLQDLPPEDRSLQVMEDDARSYRTPDANRTLEELEKLEKLEELEELEVKAPDAKRTPQVKVPETNRAPEGSGTNRTPDAPETPGRNRTPGNPDEADARIFVDDISFCYKQQCVLDSFSVDLPAAGCVAFTGPSGRGKTTLFQLIAGLLQPDSGSIRAEGMPWPILSYVFQDDRLLPWFTVQGNIEVVMHDVPRRQKQERARELLTMVGLGDDLRKYPSELSGGMKQRVNIARALAIPAQVVLLDEPFKGLDPASKQSIKALLREQKTDKLLLLITHDPEDVADLADRVVCL